jgi:hypothetical protein
MKDEQFNANTNLNGCDVSARVQVTALCDWGWLGRRCLHLTGEGLHRVCIAKRAALDRGWVALSPAHHAGRKSSLTWSWNSRAGGLVILRLESAEARSMS